MERFANAMERDWIDELSYFEKLEKTRIPLVKIYTRSPNGKERMN